MTEEELIFGVKPGTDATALETAQAEAVVAMPHVEELRNVPNTTPMTRLAETVMGHYKTNENFRRSSGVTEKLLYCLRAQTCAFSDEQKRKLSTILPPDVVNHLFVPITSTKIRTARSMLIDLVNQSGDPLFRIEPSPLPEADPSVTEAAVGRVNQGIQELFASLAQQGVQEVPPEVMTKLQQLITVATANQYDAIEAAVDEHSRTRAKRMQRKVWDVLVQGGFNKAFEDYIDSICTFGTGVIIGPVLRTEASNVCKRDKSGVVKYKRVYKVVPTYESVNPLDCYPAPDAHEVDDGPLCICVKYTSDELWRYAHACSKKSYAEGWNDAVVGDILDHHPNGLKLTVANYMPDRRFCENNGFEDVNDCTYEGVRCFMRVRGRELLEMGIVKNRDGKIIERDTFYATETIVIDNRVVYCRIYDEIIGLPISKGVFYTLPGSWWGESIASKVSLCQTVLNNCIKSLMANMPASSGAIYWVNDVQRLANKSPNALQLKAGMTIPFMTSMTGNSGAPIGAISVPSNASELLAVWKQMQTQADLDSGLPAYTEGQSSGQSGALRTAAGLAMFTEASSRGMKMVMTTTDNMVIRTVARRTADWVLLNDDNMDLKGDVEIMPVGLIGKILKAQRDQQRVQIFNLVVNNQFLIQVIGPKGIMALLRPSLEGIDIDPNDVLPSKSKVEELEIIQGIKQIFEATQASNGVQENAQQPTSEGQGGVEQPQPVQGGVAERRGVA